MRFFVVFLRFLLNFRGLRTWEIVLTPTRQHYFREIAFFVFGPPFGWILPDYGLIFDQKNAPKWAPGPSREKNRFWVPIYTYFIDFLVDFGAHLAPLGRSFSRKNHDRHWGNALFGPPGRPGVDFRAYEVDLGASGVDFGAFSTLFSSFFWDFCSIFEVSEPEK